MADPTSRRAGERSRRPVMIVGMEHVRLGYDYLNDGDFDAYGSLLDPEAVLVRAGSPPVLGRAAIERFWRCRWPSVHEMSEIIEDDPMISAVGRMIVRPPSGVVDLRFRDVFTLSDYGLLLVHRAEYYCRRG